MRRRKFLCVLAGGAVAWPVLARAQKTMPVIGTLYGVSAHEWTSNMAGFRRGLSEAGFVEGRNVTIEARWADGHFDRIPAMAADLINRKVAVILVGGNTPGVRAVIAATQSIPIVFTVGTDPVAAGLVASLNRPGGNATGFTQLNSELTAKRLELLHEAIPTATKIAMLVNSNNPVTKQSDVQNAQAAAHRLGLEIIVLDGGTESDLERAFATAFEQRAGALVVGSDAFFYSQRDKIAALAQGHTLPTIAGERAAVALGVLMSYGSNLTDLFRQAGVYAGRILKGEKPADLPVQQPTKFDPVINLKTAKALGLTVPPPLLARADEVIE